MRRFREGAVRILVATDVLPAGIDVNHVMHVGTGGWASKQARAPTHPARSHASPPLHAQRTVVQPSEHAQRGSPSFLYILHSGEVGPSNSQPRCKTSIQARPVLIVTDGHWLLRILQICAVISIDLPRDNDAYLHRVGRAGQFGRKKLAVSLVAADEAHRVRELAEHYGCEVRACHTYSPIP